MLPADEMKALVDEIVVVGNELRAYCGHHKVPARPRPGATPAALTAIRNRFARRVPPSYVQLLSLYDGIDNFDWVDVSVLTTTFLLSHPDQDRVWVEAGNFPAGERFIFAQSDTDPHAIAFLFNRVGDDGEMEVMDFDNDGPVETYQNLEAYLRDRRDWFASEVAKEKADRAGLTDDE
jgi:hypothetical protein